MLQVYADGSDSKVQRVMLQKIGDEWKWAGRAGAVKYPSRLLEVELLELPGKSVSKKAARDLYRVLRDEKIRQEPF